jgi:hypothetical protein
LAATAGGETLGEEAKDDPNGIATVIHVEARREGGVAQEVSEPPRGALPTRLRPSGDGRPQNGGRNRVEGRNHLNMYSQHDSRQKTLAV